MQIANDDNMDEVNKPKTNSFLAIPVIWGLSAPAFCKAAGVRYAPSTSTIYASFMKSMGQVGQAL